MRKIRKIRAKIILSFISICIVSVVLTAVGSYLILNRIEKKQAEETGKNYAYYNSKIIGTWLDEKSTVLYNINYSLELNNFDNEEKVIELLYNYSETNDDFISIFIGLENNKMLDAYGWIPNKTYDLVSRPWYIAAFENDSAVATSVYKDKNKNKMVTAVAMPTEIRGIRGVIAANIEVNEIIERVENIKYGKTGFAVLIDNNNYLVAGPKDEEKIKIYESVIEKINLNKENGEKTKPQTVNVFGQNYLTTYANIKPYGWNIILIAPEIEFLEYARNMLKYLLVLLLALLIIITYTGYYLGKSISTPIDKVINSVNSLAKGNLDDEINIDSDDEIGKLSQELNKMRLNLKSIFHNMKYESKVLSMNTKTLEEHLKDTHKGTMKFMSLLSHDIKTPITLIKGYAQGLKIGIVKEEEKKQEYIERIFYRAEQIETIVSDILDTTYEVNDRIVLNLKRIKIKDYINTIYINASNCVESMDRIFEKEINIVDNEKELKIDFIKIQRVMNNLLSNAVKFSDKGSKIKLIVKQEGDKLFTIIKDEGCGIKKEDKNKIFNMFYKADSHNKGYGLGLYISKAIINAHGGEIIIESKEKKGTSIGFYVNL